MAPAVVAYIYRVVPGATPGLEKKLPFWGSPCKAANIHKSMPTDSRLPHDSILHLMLEAIMTALDFSSYSQMVL